MNPSKKEVAEFGKRYWIEMQELDTLSPPVYRLQKSLKLLENVLKRFFHDPSLVADKTHKFIVLSDRVSARRDAINNYDKLRKALALRNAWSHDPDSSDPRVSWSEAEAGKAPEYLAGSSDVQDTIRDHLESLFYFHGIKTPASGRVAESKPEDSVNRVFKQNRPDLETKSNTSTPPPATRSQAHLRAGRDDPELKAAAIAEHYFCPRAGIIANTINYRFMPKKLPSLYLLPWYEIDGIRNQLNDAVFKLWRSVVATILATFAFIAFGLPFTDHNPVLVAVFLLVFAFGFCKFASNIVIHWERRGNLKARLREHESASADEPDPADREMQPVNWWALLKSGFAVETPEEKLDHPEWKLAGKPDRILVKGALRIPVFEMKIAGRKPKKPEAKHISKAIAYCKLLQYKEFESPYAVVLSQGLYSGFSVSAYSDSNIGIFEAGLAKLRRVLKSTDDPPEPTDGRCKGCPHGKAHVCYEGAVFEKSGVPISRHLLRVKSKKQDIAFHSACGDYFRWIPKHDSCKNLVVRSSVKS